MLTFNYEGEDYIVKYSSRFDPKNIAELEYKYMTLAREAGINIPDIKLVTSKLGSKYFLIKRLSYYTQKIYIIKNIKIKILNYFSMFF